MDDTYDRILQRIPVEHKTEAQIIFNLLAFSTRPITLGEAAEAAAIDLERGIFDSQDRLRDPSSILEICSSLVTLAPTGRRFAEDDSSKELRFAHFSVKEYLQSDRVSQKGIQIVVREDSAHQQLSRLCLIYLLSINFYPFRSELPYLRYASHNWYVHSQHVQLANNLAVLNLLSALFKSENLPKIHNLLKLHSPDYGGNIGFSRLYLASFLGFTEICEELLNATNKAQGGDEASYGNQPEEGIGSLQSGPEVNAQGGYFGTALQAASYQGHERIVRLLLQSGARYGNALQAASCQGHEGIVRLLLQSGADINARGGFYGNALQAASYHGHERTVRLLLQSGADSNAQGGYFGTALQAASFRGHERTVRLLLQSGADINAQGGYFGTALQAASFRGHERTVRLLFQSGADINAQGGFYGNALQAASYHSHERTVRLLLQSGADINAQGGRYGNALQAASCQSHEGIVRLLLQSGVDINAQGRTYGNALHVAQIRGDERILKLLLHSKADVHVQGGDSL